MAGSRKLQPLLFWCVLCGATLLLFIVTRAVFFQTFFILSDSMVPSLYAGDRIIVYKAAYSGVPMIGSETRPVRDEVIVFSRFSEFQEVVPGRYYIKRVVGVPGDTVAVRDQLLVTNQEIQVGEQYDYGPTKLAVGQYFVTGDNRASSKDSRFFGPINFSDISGRAVAVIWSVDQSANGNSTRWNRIGKRVL